MKIKSLQDKNHFDLVVNLIGVLIGTPQCSNFRQFSKMNNFDSKLPFRSYLILV